MPVNLSLKTKLFAPIAKVPPLLQPAHLPGLDGLRAVAIIIVLVSHYTVGTRYEGILGGDIGVETFFVISGFLITSLLLKEQITKGGISLKYFYIRRFFRIIPVAYLFLLVVYLLNKFLHLGVSTLSIILAGLFTNNIGIPGLRAHSWYVGHFWSLAVEEQFYLTFPFLLAYSLNKYVRVIIVLIIVVPVIAYLGFNNVGGFYSNRVVHIAAFVVIDLWGKTVCILIGSLLAILLLKGFLSFKDNSYIRGLSLLLLTAAILIHTPTSIFYIPYSGLFIFPLLIGVVIVLNLNTKSWLTVILNNPLLVYIGTLSYSLYIWQELFSVSNNWLIKSNSVLLHIAVLFVVANVSYYFYERRFYKIKARFKR